MWTWNSMHYFQHTTPKSNLGVPAHRKIAPHLLCGFGRGKLCPWAVHSGDTDVTKHFAHPHPQSAPFLIILFICDSTRPSGLVWLEGIHGLWRYRISCVPNPPHPNPTWKHQTIMQFQPKSWKEAELEKVWEVPFPSQNDAKWQNGKMVPEWRACRALTSLFMTLMPTMNPTWLFMTYVLIMHGWSWQWGESVGAKTN